MRRAAFPSLVIRSSRVQDRPARAESPRTGFTLVELLVVIAIIGLLLAVTLPAVQQAREAARRTECRNNLKQLGLGMENHVSAWGRYPSNGWGYLWIGVPGRGTDRRQPGGWIYNLLPYLEQRALADMGNGMTGAQQSAALAELCTRSLPVLKCPSRPGGAVGPKASFLIFRNADDSSPVAKTDYSVNEGDYITDTRDGPVDLDEGDDPSYAWKDVSQATGICFLRSEIRPAHITDGQSNTYLIGEKYVNRLHYHTADDPGYDQPLYSGVDVDLNRWTLEVPRQDADATEMRRFGSVHAQGCHFVLCDGSVRFISYNINPEVHQWLGNRKDGNPSAL